MKYETMNITSEFATQDLNEWSYQGWDLKVILPVRGGSFNQNTFDKSFSTYPESVSLKPSFVFIFQRPLP